MPAPGFHVSDALYMIPANVGLEADDNMRRKLRGGSRQNLRRHHHRRGTAWTCAWHLISPRPASIFCWSTERLTYGGGLCTREVTKPGFYHNLHSINHFSISDAPWFADLNLGDKVELHYAAL